MSETQPRIKRKKPSVLPSILSLALVMFMLGLLGFSVLGFNGLSKSLVEGSGIDVYFKDSVQEFTVRNFEKALQQLSIDDADNLLEEVENMLLDLDKYVTNQVTQVSQHINNMPSGSINTQNK